MKVEFAKTLSGEVRMLFGDMTPEERKTLNEILARNAARRKAPPLESFDATNGNTLDVSWLFR